MQINIRLHRYRACLQLLKIRVHCGHFYACPITLKYYVHTYVNTNNNLHGNATRMEPVKTDLKSCRLNVPRKKFCNNLINRIFTCKRGFLYALLSSYRKIRFTSNSANFTLQYRR